MERRAAPVSVSWRRPNLSVVVRAGYFPGKVEKAGKVVRAIAVLAHPIPNTDNAASAQIILPQRQTGRKNDIYVFCSSSSHHVCAADKWLAFVSTIVETTDPERELQAGVPLLCPDGGGARRYIRLLGGME